MKTSKKEVKPGYSGEPVNANTWFYFFFADDRSWPDTILHTVGGTISSAGGFSLPFYVTVERERLWDRVQPEWLKREGSGE